MRKCIVLCLLVFFFAAAAWAAEFPLREKPEFKELTPVTTADLYAWGKAGQSVVVDVRSIEEYEVIHVNGSKHIPISQKDFFGPVGEGQRQVRRKEAGLLLQRSDLRQVV
jgi:Rhodanese-like domain.